jgi:hypothetical protein
MSKKLGRDFVFIYGEKRHNSGGNIKFLMADYLGLKK